MWFWPGNSERSSSSVKLSRVLNVVGTLLYTRNSSPFSLLHTSSFSWLNPLGLTQLPLCAGPSDTISICCNYRDPHPLSISHTNTYAHTNTHTQPTGHWCNSCCLGGRGRLWVGSINVMVHIHTHMHNLIIDEGLLTSPLLLRDIL